MSFQVEIFGPGSNNRENFSIQVSDLDDPQIRPNRSQVDQERPLRADPLKPRFDFAVAAIGVTMEILN